MTDTVKPPYPMIEGATGTLTADTNRRELTWRVVYKEQVENIEEVFRTSGVPSYGDPFPWNDDLFAVSINPQTTADLEVWDVVVTYDSLTGFVDEGFAYGITRRAVMREEPVFYAYRRRLTVEDVRGEVIQLEDVPSPDDAKDAYLNPTVPILNSAGDPFATSINVAKTKTMLEFWQLAPKSMEEFFDSDKIYDYYDTSNLDAVRVCGVDYSEGTLILREADHTVYFYKPVGALDYERRYRVRWLFEISSKNGASVKIQDNGFNGWFEYRENDDQILPRHIKTSDLKRKDNLAPILPDSKQDVDISDSAMLDGGYQMTGTSFVKASFKRVFGDGHVGTTLQQKDHDAAGFPYARYHYFYPYKPVNFKDLGIATKRGDMKPHAFS